MREDFHVLVAVLKYHLKSILHCSFRITLFFLNRAQTYDLLTGTNYDDAYLILAPIAPSILSPNRNLTAEEIENISRLLRWYSTRYPGYQDYIADIVFHSSLDWIPDQNNTELVESILSKTSTDFAFAAPAIREAQLHSQNANGSVPFNDNKVEGGIIDAMILLPICCRKSTYMYDFHIKTKIPFLPDWLTNFHVMEIPYVFGAGLRKNANDPIYDETANELSLQMMTFWTNFAQSG